MAVTFADWRLIHEGVNERVQRARGQNDECAVALQQMSHCRRRLRADYIKMAIAFASRYWRDFRSDFVQPAGQQMPGNEYRSPFYTTDGTPTVALHIALLRDAARW